MLAFVYKHMYMVIWVGVDKENIDVHVRDMHNMYNNKKYSDSIHVSFQTGNAPRWRKIYQSFFDHHVL